MNIHPRPDQELAIQEAMRAGLIASETEALDVGLESLRGKLAKSLSSHGRANGYFLSEREYREYMLLKAQTRHAYHISELPEETIAAIAKAEMNSAHDCLNSLMD